MSYILVVEDEDTLRELLEDVLAEDGHAVRTATSASRALEMAAAEHPAAIVFDMNLPDLSGVELVTRYRELPSPTAKLIAVSGIANLAAEAARIEADGFLTKPFELEDLLFLVNGALA